MVDLIVKKDSFVAFLLDIQNEWRSMRAISKDPEDRLLIGSESIDEIVNRLEKLDAIRKEIKAQQKAMEEEENIEQ